MRVSCQQAASGAPKCTICDQVCHAIIPCTTATDDENVLEHMNSAFTAREQQRRANRKRGLFFLNIVLYDRDRNDNCADVLFTESKTSFPHSQADISSLITVSVQIKAAHLCTGCAQMKLLLTI